MKNFYLRVQIYAFMFITITSKVGLMEMKDLHSCQDILEASHFDRDVMNKTDRTD
jgi:hypothetical protein